MNCLLHCPQCGLYLTAKSAVRLERFGNDVRKKTNFDVTGQECGCELSQQELLALATAMMTVPVSQPINQIIH